MAKPFILSEKDVFMLKLLTAVKIKLIKSGKKIG
jgi:hypothetical protein